MEYDKNRYKVYTWKNWMMLHWIINPGLAVNEIILGQRVPRIFLEDKTSDRPRFERNFVPCPHCGKIHDGRTWSEQNKTAFKNWFGFYCTNCGGIIPCLTNWLTFVLFVLTSPVWIWFRNDLKKHWLKNQPKRFEHLDLNSIPNPYTGKGWLRLGLTWGLIMFIIVTFLFPLFDDSEITWKSIWIGIPTWTISGLMFGYIMKIFMNKKEKTTADKNA